MKKLFFIALIIAFSGVASAQNKSKIANDITKNESYLKLQSKSKSSDNKDVQNQIKEQFVINEELGIEAINYLKSNPESANSLKKIYKENSGVVSNIMKAVMGDSKLSSTLMDWVNNNPEILNRAMQLIGM